MTCTCRAALVLLLIAASASYSLAGYYGFKFQRTVRPQPDYVLSWTCDVKNRIITVGVIVNTRGWIGWGISPDGRMFDSDIVVSVNDNAITDHRSNPRGPLGRTPPPVDEEQNIKRLASGVIDGYRFMVFKRKLDTGDKIGDRVIPVGKPVNVIFAWRNDSTFITHQNQGNILDIVLCEAPRQVCPRHRRCPYGKWWDSRRCSCVCRRHRACSYGYSWDSSRCRCVSRCRRQHCSYGYTWDWKKCACMCRRRRCYVGYSWNPKSCQCECSRDCGSYHRVNKKDCTCVPIYGRHGYYPYTRPHSRPTSRSRKW